MHGITTCSVLQRNHSPAVVTSFVYHKEETTSPMTSDKLHYVWMRTGVKVSLGGEEEAELKGFFSVLPSE